MQTVRNLLESLARFSPDAIVEPEIELGGENPWTICRTQPVVSPLEGELEEVEKERDGLSGKLEDLKTISEDRTISPVAAFEKIKTILKEIIL